MNSFVRLEYITKPEEYISRHDLRKIKNSESHKTNWGLAIELQQHKN